MLNLAFTLREGENQMVTNDHKRQHISKGSRGMMKLQITVAEFTFRGSYKSIFLVKFSICPILCHHLCHSKFPIVCGWAPHPTTNNLIYLLLNSCSLGAFLTRKCLNSKLINTTAIQDVHSMRSSALDDSVYTNEQILPLSSVLQFNFKNSYLGK